MKTSTTLAITSLLICSCNLKEEQTPGSIGLKVVEAREYIVPKDSMAEPNVIPAGKPRIVAAGKPKVIPIKNNVHTVGTPTVVPAGAPRVCTPGQDGFSLPKTVIAIDSPFLAGIPEMVTAKHAYSKDPNPQNFSCFRKLEGLKNDVISCLLQDNGGDLWIGTMGGGVSKYDGKNFTHFTVKEGLGENSLWTMLADKTGNLWFGHVIGGVTKYDGKNFTRFTAKEGFSNYGVVSIIEDRSSNLWFGTSGNGLIRYDGKNFTHFTKKEGLNGDDVSDLMTDRSGNIWVSSRNSGVCTYDGKKFTHFSKKQGLISDSLHCMVQDKSGNVWFGSSIGASKYDGKSFVHFTKKEGLSDNGIQSLFEDKNGNLWFGSRKGGACRYDGQRFTHFTEEEGLSNNYVRTILEDKHGNLWFGTEGGGVNKYNGKLFTHFTVKDGLTTGEIRSLLQDRRGNIWIGTWNGGVTKYDGKSFTQFTETEGLHKNAIVCMLEDRTGNLWFGNYNGVSRYDGKTFSYFTEKEGLSNIDVFSMLQDKIGNIWFGTFRGGVSRYDGKTFTNYTKKQGLNGNFVTSMLEDKTGNLWFGTYGGGLGKYDGKRFTHFTENEGLHDNSIMCVIQDRIGNLWIGSERGGVSKYDGKSFTYFTEKEGLSNNNIRSIYEDKLSNLWFGTAGGVSKVHKEKLTSLSDNAANGGKTLLSTSNPFFTTYSYEDGFLGTEVRYGKTILEAKDGTIWIGTADRLTAFHSGQEILDTIAPNIQLTGITLFNENIDWHKFRYDLKGSTSTGGKDTSILLSNGMLVRDLRFDDLSKWYSIPEHLSLPYNNNYLTFQFVGVTIHSPKKVKYQYKLEGLDKNWSALTSRAEATYGNLPHGKYTFKVKAMNSDGYWSNEFKYPFRIRPPWWHTWWAYTLFALLFTGFIYTLFRYRLNKIRKQHEIKQKTAELEMQALRAQMNPHFIFNSLNSINLFILENNKLQASEYLSKFSRLVRLILNNSQESFIPLENELAALQLYLELEALRFEQRFHYQITVEDSVDTALIKVPPLIIQPYAENAIWHGLMHKKDVGHLEIQLYQQGEILFCKITDDGVGRKTAAQLKSKSASKSVGMRITADRIAILQDSSQHNPYVTVTDLVLPDGTPGGTEVLLRIPHLSWSR